jgi:MFS family permease
MSIINTVKSFPKQFWLLNSIQTIERLAYWIVLLQMPIYIAQKDLPGGLHWEHSIKGLIFFWWALVQNISPVFMGGFADKFGRKKVMFITSILIVAGFLLLGNFKTFYPFLFSTLLLGLGMGVFKPALQGEVSKNISKNNSALGWGIYTTFVNVAYFLGPSFSIYLKNISWDYVFWGSAIIHSLNLILIYFVKEQSDATNKNKTIKQILADSKEILKSTCKNIVQPQVIIFLLLITGFTLNHMQFYESLSNFVVDWSDTSTVAQYLPAFMHKETSRGTMISFEWIFNINSTMLVLFVAFSSWLTRNKNLLRVCGLGLIFVAVGLFIAGRTMDGTLLISGVFLLAIGEMLIIPRISQYFSLIAPPNLHSQYLGYANLAWALGLSGGGIIGGFLYQNMAEKSSFAIKYLAKEFGIENVNHSEAILLLCQKTNLLEPEVTLLLWNTYNPWHFWLPFLIFGIICSIGLFIFSKK